MALTDLEIQAVKYYLGYGGLTVLALPYLETAPMFEVVVQQNCNEFVEDLIRNTILPNLAQIEEQLSPGGAIAARFGIKELVGDVVFETGGVNGGKTQFTMLGEMRTYWVNRLGSAIRIKPLKAPGSTSSCEVY